MLEVSVQVNLLNAPPLTLLHRKPCPWTSKFSEHKNEKDVEEEEGEGEERSPVRREKSVSMKSLMEGEEEEEKGTTMEEKKRTLKLPWHSGCEYQCRICHLLYFYVEDLRSHIRREHCSPDQYLERYRLFETKADFIACKRCGKEIKRSFFSCRNHLMDEHGMTLEEYQKKHKQYRPRHVVVAERLLDPNLLANGVVRKADGGEEAVQSRPSPQKRKTPSSITTRSESRLQSSSPSSKYSASATPVSTLPEGKTMPVTRSAARKGKGSVCSPSSSSLKQTGKAAATRMAATTKAAAAAAKTPVSVKARFRKGSTTSSSSRRKEAEDNQSGSSSRTEGESVDSRVRPWYSGCEFHCKLCGEPGDSSSGGRGCDTLEELFSHLKSAHSVSPAEYKRRHGGFETKSASFRCGICGESVRHTEQSVRKHLETTHLLSLSAYEKVILSMKEKDEGEEKKKRKADDSSGGDLKEPATSPPTKLVKINFTMFGASGKGTRLGQESQKSPVPVVKSVEPTDDDGVNPVQEEEDNSMTKAENMSSESESNASDDNNESHKDDSDDDDNQKAPTNEKGDEEEEGEEDRNTLVESLDVFLKGGCTYACKLCQFTCPDSSFFWKHAKGAHDLEPSAYTAAHGKARTKEAKLECPSCHKIFVHDLTSLTRHACEHGVSAQDYYRRLFRKGKGGEEEEEEREEEEEEEEEASQEFRETYVRWTKRCRFVCWICKEDMDNFRRAKNHIACKHFMTTDDYQMQHGPLMSKRTKHRCLLCQERILHLPWILGKHMLSRHGMTLLQYYKAHKLNEQERDAGSVMPMKRKKPRRFLGLKRRARRWSNQCKYTCQVCRTTFSFARRAYSHLKSMHNLTEAEYVKTFGPVMTGKKMHSCRMCGSEVVHEISDLRSHLKGHRMTLHYYFAAYISPASDGDEKGRGKKDSAELAKCEMDLEERRLRDPSLFSEAAAASLASDPSPSTVVEATTGWMNGCTYECASCRGRLTSMASFREHLEQLHQVDFEDYVFCHGDPAVSIGLFTCAACGAVLTHDADDIVPHLAQTHDGMTPEEYHARHPVVEVEGGTGTGAVSVVGKVRSVMAPAPSRSWSRNHGENLKFTWNHCVSFCPACLAKFTNEKQMYHHLRQRHALGAVDVLDRTSRYHTCRICSSSVKLTTSDVTKHLRRKHDMSVVAYEDAFEDALRAEMEAAALATAALKHPGFDHDYCGGKRAAVAAEAAEAAAPVPEMQQCSGGLLHPPPPPPLPPDQHFLVTSIREDVDVKPVLMDLPI